MLVSIDGTSSNFRFARPKKHANMTNAENVANAPVALNMFSGHGGESEIRRMVGTVIRSGHFDEEVLNYANELEGEDVGIATNSRITTTFVNSVEELQQIRQNRIEERKAAERARKASEINGDPNIGATTESVTAAGLRARMQRND